MRPADITSEESDRPPSNPARGSIVFTMSRTSVWHSYTVTQDPIPFPFSHVYTCHSLSPQFTTRANLIFLSPPFSFPPHALYVRNNTLTTITSNNNTPSKFQSLHAQTQSNLHYSLSSITIHNLKPLSKSTSGFPAFIPGFPISENHSKLQTFWNFLNNGVDTCKSIGVYA